MAKLEHKLAPDKKHTLCGMRVVAILGKEKSVAFFTDREPSAPVNPEYTNCPGCKGEI